MLICPAAAAQTPIREMQLRLTALLQHPQDSGAVLVQQVARESLHLDPTNAKTPAIVDFRN